jgi:hypothetical protein
MREEWIWDPPRLELLDLSRAADFKQFVHRYFEVMDGREALAQILKVMGGNGGILCYVERDYIDRDYRDEFANFYAQTYRSLLDRCQRLHFFSAENRYLGFVVLRPIPSRLISRTMIAPPSKLREFVCCLSTDIASPHGSRFPIEAAPFISQDFQYGVCAHAAIWMVAQYFNLRYGGPRYHMSDIVQATRTRPGRHRTTPSRGLTAGQLSGALDELGMLPLSYQLKNDESRKDAHGAARCYLNSRIPVILSRGRHAQVLIGYFHDQDGNRIYIAHDDVRGPYQLLDDFDNAELLLVPSPGRIYLDASLAETAAQFHFERLMSSDPIVKEHLTTPDDNLQLRAYVTEIAHFRENLAQRGLTADARAWLNMSSASHWVWAVELQDMKAAAKGRNCVIGEMIVDATTDERNAHVLFGLMPGRVYRWSDPKRGETKEPSQQVDLYSTGCAIHSVA